MPGQFRCRTKARQSGIFSVRYRTEIIDAGMPMPALVFWMPMPSYAFMYIVMCLFSLLHRQLVKTASKALLTFNMCRMLSRLKSVLFALKNTTPRSLQRTHCSQIPSSPIQFSAELFRYEKEFIVLIRCFGTKFINILPNLAKNF